MCVCWGGGGGVNSNLQKPLIFVYSTIVGKVPRIAITFKSNLTCGDDQCFKHTDLQTSIREIIHRYDLIKETMNIFQRNEYKYNQTDVIIRYFSEEKGPVVYACKEATHEDVIEDRDLKLCSKSYYI